jgi:sec-independent protein translocase protein TatA
MGLSNPIHLIFILAIALLVLGPKRLPEVARSVGNGIKEFRGSLGGADDPETSLSAAIASAPASAGDPEA